VSAPAADFTAFYREIIADLSGYAYSLTRDQHVADELTQEALTRVYVRWSIIRDPQPYAYRIVTNLVKQRWRQGSREGELSFDPAAEPVVPGPDDATLDAVRRLSPALREAVALHYYADLPVEEVARVLRRPVGTVKRRLHDARKALEVSLGGVDD
jgi:RNA polymerase sigma-70 factor (ECF subfamily)